MITVQDFATACIHLTADEIYNLFEYDTPDAVRNEIYNYSDPQNPEPVRQAFNEIGRRYSVQSLAQY